MISVNDIGYYMRKETSANADDIELPFALRIALMLWILGAIGGAIEFFFFDDKSYYEVELSALDEVVIWGIVSLFILELSQIVRLIKHKASAVKLLLWSEVLDAFLFPFAYRSLSNGETMLEFLCPDILISLVIILLLVSPGARQWVALAGKHK